MKLRCVVERITYQNPENGYSVLKVKVKDYADLVTLVGNLLDVTVGSVLLVEGQWKVDKKYGQQFLAETWEETMPATLYGIEKYLGSGLVKGVGPVFAQRIVRRFGLETINVIEDDINQLFQVDGIGPKRVARIQESWERQKDIKNVMLFLQGNGVSTAFAAKIYRAYGKESIEKVKENPYRLADDIWGIGFKTADSIAEKLGYGKNDPRRVRSGIIYALGQLSDEGHVYAEREHLVKTASELLEAGGDVVETVLDDMIQADDLKQDLTLKPDTEAIYLPPFYFAEIGVTNGIKRLVDAPWQLNLDPPLDINAISRKTGIVYDDVQKEAIRTAVQSKVMVLTGGPGTGKTTTTQAIIAALSDRGHRIMLAAPTGRAAKRMTEATGMEAKTIHRLLEFKPPEGYQRNDGNPLEGDVLIVDEASMVDILLMNALVKALPDSMRLVLVGDIDQLPSVGAGNVLRDVIDSGTVPVVRLTRIFRQAQQSRIIMNAHRVNRGEFPDISNGRNTDFFFIGCDDPEEAAAKIVDLVKNRLPKAYGERPRNVQVLTPMQRGVVGAGNLNQQLQSALNTSDLGIHRSGWFFKLYDKVMQIRNNYDKEVFNGDIGYISAVNAEDRTLTINFDGREIEYDHTELDEITLAYATTVHKAQGSEFPIVVIPVLMTHYVMLQRNLIYTGITRAKRICVLIGSTKALGIAVRNFTVNKRNTGLKERLQQSVIHGKEENRKAQ